MTSGTPDGNHLARIRVGDTERDDVIALLNDAVEQGRLTAEEFHERLSATLAAKTFGDLDAVVADLPVPPPSESAARPRGSAPASAPSAANRSDILVLHTTWDDEKRVGRWHVPPFIRVEPIGATTTLNFLDVSTHLRAIDLEITPGVGATVVVVPEDWGVNVDHLSSVWGSVRSDVSTKPSGGAPHITVRGSVGVGSFVARHANYFERRRVVKK